MVNPYIQVLQKQVSHWLFGWLVEPFKWKIRFGLFGLMSAWHCMCPKYINRTFFESKIIFQIGDINQSLNPQPTSNLWLDHQAWHNFAPLVPFMLYDIPRGFHDHHSNEPDVKD